MLGVLAAILPWRCVSAQRPTGRKQSRKKVTMSSPPNNSSLIGQATHILLLRVESSQATAWREPPNTWMERDVDLWLTLEEVLEGHVRATTGARIRARVRQFENPSLVPQDPPGVWSGIGIDPDTRLLVFSIAAAPGEQADAAALIVEPSCRRVVPAEPSLPGVRLALRHRAGRLTLPDLLAEANRAASEIDYLFIEYLSTLLSDSSLSGKEAFERLMALLENPRLDLLNRSALLLAVLDAVPTAPIYSAYHINRLAIALLRLGASDPDDGMRHNILSVYFPNLVGLVGGADRRSAAEVFHDFPAERAKILAMLKQAGEPAAAQVIQWLEAAE